MTVIGIGVPYTLVQNEVVALPSTLCQVMVTVACEVSVDGVVWAAFTNNTITAANFIRCTTGSSVVSAKSAVIQSSSGGGTSIGPTTDLVVNSVTAAAYVAAGTNPAQSGVIRIPNGNGPAIMGRNVGNTADINALKVIPGGSILIGESAANTQTAGQLDAAKGVNINVPGVPFGSTVPLTLTGTGVHIMLEERAVLPTASPNRAILFAQDNGSGKTQLMALFPTGGPVQVAIEP